MTLNRRPITPEGVAYQLINFMAIWRQHADNQCRSVLPNPGATCCCNSGSLCRLPETKGAHVLGQRYASQNFPLEGARPSPHRRFLQLSPSIFLLPLHLPLPLTLFLLNSLWTLGLPASDPLPLLRFLRTPSLHHQPPLRLGLLYLPFLCL